MAHKVGIIDVGTNTINLLIVDKSGNEFEILHKNRTGVGLGHSGINNATIKPPAFQRGIKCLKNYADICNHYQANKILAFGTSALRNAKNAKQFIQEVKQKSSIDIEVINGDKEAELIYKGINLLYNFKEKTVVMDIGGGSTEFILADNNGIIHKTSLEIGLSRINQNYHFNDPFCKDDIAKIENYLNTSIGNKLDNYKTNYLIGSSGSFKTFYELLNGQKHPINTCKKIKLDDFIAVLNQVIQSTYAQRQNNPLIEPIRYEMLHIAAFKIKWIINKLNIKHILISPYSLKEGVIFSV
ncbi:MAG TPA: hypothetical protein EYG85_00450 [Crocinitomix sp.]|nr:hypothetical protein [Crocinitomix sp.]